jgi:hypothetical protein
VVVQCAVRSITIGRVSAPTASASTTGGSTDDGIAGLQRFVHAFPPVGGHYERDNRGDNRFVRR